MSDLVKFILTRVVILGLVDLIWGTIAGFLPATGAYFYFQQEKELYAGLTPGAGLGYLDDFFWPAGRQPAVIDNNGIRGDRDFSLLSHH